MKQILFALLALPISAFADGGLPTQPYIYVVGTADIQKPADMVTLRFDLVARNAEQTKANQEVQAKAAKILASLNEKKIAQNDVIAGSINSEAQFQEDQNSRPNLSKLIGYKVARSFDVKIRDVTAFPKLVDELFAIGGLEFSGIEPGLSNDKEMQNQIWQKALTDAREQADKTLKPMNMKIDSVFAFSPVPFLEIQTKIFMARERFVVTGSNIPTPGPEYRLAPVTINQSVHVIYLISPAK